MSTETKSAEAARKPLESATENSEPKKDEAQPAAGADVEMKDAAPTLAAQAAPAAPAEDAGAAKKQPAARRKSAAGEGKGKALNKKGSKAKLTHTDAKPGDHFLVKLKGFPAWPAIICDEDMLPQALLNSRPVSAAKPDGTYGEPFAEGGKRINDRTFPVMYLFTYEL